MFPTMVPAQCLSDLSYTYSLIVSSSPFTAFSSMRGYMEHKNWLKPDLFSFGCLSFCFAWPSFSSSSSSSSSKSSSSSSSSWESAPLSKFSAVWQPLSSRVKSPLSPLISYVRPNSSSGPSRWRQKKCQFTSRGMTSKSVPLLESST